MGMSTTRKSTIWVWILVMAAFLGELLFYTWCRVQSVQIGYEIAEAGDYRKKLISYRNNLAIELASLKSPQRIMEIARRRLDMVMPTAEQTIVMP